MCVCVSFILFSSSTGEKGKKKPAKINLKLVNSNRIPFYICFESYFQLEHSLLLIICEQCFDFIFNLFLISFHHFARGGDGGGFFSFSASVCATIALAFSRLCNHLSSYLFFSVLCLVCVEILLLQFFFVLFCQHFIFNHLFFCFIWLLLWWCESAHLLAVFFSFSCCVRSIFFIHIACKKLEISFVIKMDKLLSLSVLLVCVCVCVIMMLNFWTCHCTLTQRALTFAVDATRAFRYL